jgi:hypothetical protein
VITSSVCKSEMNPIYIIIAVIVLQYVRFSKLIPPNVAKGSVLIGLWSVRLCCGNDTNIRNRSMIIGPNHAGEWTPEQVWATGFFKTYASSLTALSVEKYPWMHWMSSSSLCFFVAVHSYAFYDYLSTRPILTITRSFAESRLTSLIFASGKSGQL